MKCRARGARLNGRRVGCDAHEFKGLRYRQCRWRCGHRRARERGDGADRAKIIRMLIRIVAGRRQLLGGLDRRRSLRRERVEVAE